ncbi:MAG: PhzF family phenazine biosynthesis protein [Sciscionella sp.]|nr:PhzF family phenazine biosynthesis protein [Sciscionella sp.]
MNETLHILKVFIGDDGRGGNLLGVFLNTDGFSDSRRQKIAADLGYSETVFVDDVAKGKLRIFTPAIELPLAGHPLVGTSYLLANSGHVVEVLRPPAGEVRTWTADGHTWISANPEWAPEFELTQLDSPAEVDAYPGAGPGEHRQVWAWQDENAGIVRVRVFPTAMGIVEDEATGAAALRLGAKLGRKLTINQGVASKILVQPEKDGNISVGGRVELVETKQYS